MTMGSQSSRRRRGPSFDWHASSPCPAATFAAVLASSSNPCWGKKTQHSESQGVAEKSHIAKDWRPLHLSAKCRK
ncbi:hypothetical protein EJB05_24822 [Eragrostis curvula]|uniref:Uncharacterized protein n=1 Tax=Eragrostis curvula TaxID=38414 RepID=A0A5J9VC44_9POAL|nr:hypothetical protein EJB05_24822 [Eragrostis curvula]